MGIYAALTDYLPEMKNDSHGEWIVDSESKGTMEDPIQMPYVSYSDMVRRFQRDVHKFVDDHPEYELTRYTDILEANGKLVDVLICEHDQTRTNTYQHISSKSGRTVFHATFQADQPTDNDGCQYTHYNRNLGYFAKDQSCTSFLSE